jgi:RNA polymerase sigma factor (sigma-70 family)
MTVIERRGVAVDDPISDFLRHGYGELLGWMAGRAPSGADFEAAIQEALMQAWVRPPGEIDSLEGWLRTVALNRVRTDLRRRDAEARAFGRRQVEEVLTGHDGVVSQIDWEQVLGQLSNGQREAVVLHYFEDRSVEEVAAALGVAAGTVKTQLYRARARLAGLIERAGGPAGFLEEGTTMKVKDWFMAGSHPRDYEYDVLRDEVFESKRVVALRCIAERPGGFGTLMQQCAPNDFIGHRVRFSGALRSRNVDDWTGLWFRVDGGSGRTLAFDNMQDRCVRGTTDWSRYDVVLDVVDDATQLAYGVLLSGTGEVAVADFHLERVGTDVPPTDQRHRLARPSNLDFSEA